MITNNFNKELRGISDALRDLGYTDSTIGLRQRYWKEYCFFHGSLDIDEASMDEFLLKNYDIQSGNINVSKRQYEVRAALRNLLEYRRYGKIRNYHTPWFKDLPWVESFRAITEDFISHLRSQNSKPETIVNYERTLKRITNHLHILVVPHLKWVVWKIVDQLKGNISDFTELGIVPKLLCRKQVIERRQSEVALSSCHRQTPPLRTQHKPLQQDCSAHTCRCLRLWKQPLRLSLP